jgi:hypothetical protein
MSISLESFIAVVNAVTGTITDVYTMLQGAILIDDPIRMSLFDVAFGFVLLEFLIYTINRFRTPNGDMSGLTPQQINQHGGIGNKEYGPKRPRRY